MRYHIVPELFVLDSCVAERDVTMDANYPSDEDRPAARTFGTQLSRGAALPTTSMLVTEVLKGPAPINSEKLPYRFAHKYSQKVLEKPAFVATYDDKYLLAALGETYCRDDFIVPAEVNTREPIVTHGYRSNPITVLGLDQMDSSLDLKANKKLLPIYMGCDDKNEPNRTRDASTGVISAKSNGGSWKQNANLEAKFCDGRGFTSRNAGSRATVNGIKGRCPGGRHGAWPYHDSVSKNADNAGNVTHWGVVEDGVYKGDGTSYWYKNDSAPSLWKGRATLELLAKQDYSSALALSLPQASLHGVQTDASVESGKHIGESESFSRKNLRGSLCYTMAYNSEARKFTIAFAPYLSGTSLAEKALFDGYTVDAGDYTNMKAPISSLRRHCQQRGAMEMTTRALYLAGAMANAISYVAAAELAARAHTSTTTTSTLAGWASLYKDDWASRTETCAPSLCQQRQQTSLPRWLNIARSVTDFEAITTNAEATGFRPFFWAKIEDFDDEVDGTTAIPSTPWNPGTGNAGGLHSVWPRYATPGEGELVVAPHWSVAPSQQGPESNAVTHLRFGAAAMGILLDVVMQGNVDDLAGAYEGSPSALSLTVANGQTPPVNSNGNVVALSDTVYGTSPAAANSVYDSRAAGCATWASTLKAPLVDADHIVMANGAIRRADAMGGYSALKAIYTDAGQFDNSLNHMAGHSPVLLATKALFAAAGAMSLYRGQAPQHNIWTAGGWYMGTINPGATGTHNPVYYEGDLDD